MSFTTSEVCVFLRKVVPAYGGNCIRVQRASDSATQDIGFIGDDIDEFAIESFCAGTDGRVTIWYDQSGNGNNLTPGTTGPLIARDGALLRHLGEVCVDWDGADYLEVDITDLAQPGSVFARVIDDNAETINGTSVFTSSDNATDRWQIYKPYATDGYAIYAGSTVSTGDSVLSPNWLSLLGIFDGASSELFVNGTSAATGNAGAGGLTTFRLGADNSGGAAQHRFTTGAAVWDSDQASNAATIHRDGTSSTAYDISRVLFDANGSGGDWTGRSSLQEAANGVLVAAFREGSDHTVNDGEIFLRFSDDDGDTWTARNVYTDAGAITFTGYPNTDTEPADLLGPGEPWIIRMPNDDLCLYCWSADYNTTERGTWMTRSTDNGKTWSSYSQVDWDSATTGVDNDLVFGTDDHYVNPDDGLLYVAARIYSDQSGTSKRIAVYTSSDNGATYDFVSYLSAFTDNCNECGMTYLGSGNTLALLRINDNSETYKVTSSDDWSTPSALTAYSSTLGLVFSRARIYSVDQLIGNADWEDDPRLVVVGFRADNPGASSERTNGLLYSHDQGTSWRFWPLDVNNFEGGYGDIAYNSARQEIVCHNYTGTAYTAASTYQYNLPLADLFPADFAPALKCHNSLLSTGSHTADPTMLAHYACQDDAASSTAIDDASSYANDGTLNGGDDTETLSTTGPTTYLPKSLEFDGAADYFDTGITSIENDNNTILAWSYRLDVNEYSFFAANRSGGSGGQWQYWTDDSDTGNGTRQQAWNGTAVVNSTNETATPLNTWVHIGWQRSGNFVRFYQDGVPSDSVSNTAPAASSHELVIGTDKGSGFAFGRVAGVVVFERSVPDLEVREIYDGPEQVNTAAPEITGTLAIGDVLTCSTGTWDLAAPYVGTTNGSITYSYRWSRADDASGTNEVLIPGANSSTYTIVDDDDGKHLRCLVRASNAGGFDGNEDTYAPFTGPAGTDTTKPTVQSASINTAGAFYTVVYDEPVTGQTGHTLSATGGEVTLTPSSGDTTDTHVWSLDRTIGEDEVLTRSYTPGNAVDVAGNPLEAYSGQPVTNGVVEDSSSSSSSSSQSSDSSSWSSESSSSVSVSDSSSSGLGDIIITVNLSVGGVVAGSCSFTVDAHVLPLSDM
jgi:hypothetical protein